MLRRGLVFGGARGVSGHELSVHVSAGLNLAARDPVCPYSALWATILRRTALSLSYFCAINTGEGKAERADMMLVSSQWWFEGTAACVASIARHHGRLAVFRLSLGRVPPKLDRP